LTVSSVASSLMNTLAQIASAGAQTQSQEQLSIIGNRMTAQLNQKIAQLQAQANDPMIPILQQQSAVLSQQQTSYATAQSQLVANGGPIDDLDTQLNTMATAAAASDSATFDLALSTANTDLANLNAVQPLPGFQPDGAANLKTNGLGVQTSAGYDLSTPAGQAQAAADISAAQTAVSQLSTMTTQNTQIAISVDQALSTQIGALEDQVTSLETSQTTSAVTQIQTLQTQTQTQFHLIELAMGSAGNTGSMLQDFETAQAANAAATAAPGSILNLLDTQVPSTSSSTSSSSSSASSSSSRANSSSAPSSTFSTLA
jgi:hypothetical protein